MALRQLDNERAPGNPDQNNSKAPKLPSFVEGKDKINNFIQRFERYARANLWLEENWTISLGALLTGKALEAYTRLSEEDAMNYQELKNVFLKRYNLTEEGYHEKFRKCRPEPEETVDQFIFRIRLYLEKWVELANVDASVDGFKNLIIKEQVIDVCPRDLSIYLQERAPRTLDEISMIAEQYLKARNRQFHQKINYQCAYHFRNIKLKIQTTRKSMKKQLMKKSKDLMSHVNSARSRDIELRIAFSRNA